MEKYNRVEKMNMLHKYSDIIIIIHEYNSKGEGIYQSLIASLLKVRRQNLQIPIEKLKKANLINLHENSDWQKGGGTQLFIELSDEAKYLLDEIKKEISPYEIDADKVNEIERYIEYYHLSNNDAASSSFLKSIYLTIHSLAKKKNVDWTVLSKMDEILETNTQNLTLIQEYYLWQYSFFILREMTLSSYYNEKIIGNISDFFNEILSIDDYIGQYRESLTYLVEVIVAFPENDYPIDVFIFGITKHDILETQFSFIDFEQRFKLIKQPHKNKIHDRLFKEYNKKDEYEIPSRRLFERLMEVLR